MQQNNDMGGSSSCEDFDDIYLIKSAANMRMAGRAKSLAVTPLNLLPCEPVMIRSNSVNMRRRNRSPSEIGNYLLNKKL